MVIEKIILFSLLVALGFEVVFSSLELFPWLKHHYLICDIWQSNVLSICFLQLKYSELNFHCLWWVQLCTSSRLQLIDKCRYGDIAFILNLNLCLFAPSKTDKTGKKLNHKTESHTPALSSFKHRCNLCVDWGSWVFSLLSATILCGSY